MTLVEQAEDLARKAHHHQFRRDGVTPYIRHCERVVARLQAQGVTDEATLAAAWCHDTIEDGVLVWRTLEDEGIPDDVVEAVTLLTKPLGMTYMDYLARLSGNKVACKVKIADILDNLSDAPTRRQIVKYATALLYLHP